MFVRNTTSGTTTDRDGSFRFLSPAFSSEMVVVASMVGFQTQSAEIARGPGSEVSIAFRLSAKVYALDEVAVSSSNKEWKRNLERVTQLLFNDTENGHDCEILNPEYLSITYNEDTGIVTASSEVPIEILNHALGYAITIHDFSVTGTDVQLLRGGEMQFRELVPKNERQRTRWARSRDRAYKGSTKHFIGSLLSHTLNDAKFEVYAAEKPGVVVVGSSYKPKIDITPLDGVGADTTISVFRLSFPQALFVKYTGETEPTAYVQYMMDRNLRGPRRMGIGERPRTRNYQASWLTLPGGSVILDEMGRVYGSRTMQRFGYWAWERLGEALPAEYVPIGRE